MSHVRNGQIPRFLKGTITFKRPIGDQASQSGLLSAQEFSFYLKSNGCYELKLLFDQQKLQGLDVNRSKGQQSK